jgi:twitching motility protein PilT
MDLNQLLSDVHASGIPDLHLQVGKYPVIRLKNGDVAPVDKAPILTNALVTGFIKEITSDEQRKDFAKEHEIDFSFSIKSGGRFRVNVFEEREGPALAFRVISQTIPQLDELGLGEPVKNLLQLNHGFILVTGPTGCGKSTTMASMIDYINATKKCHIITIEDPIEYVYENKQSLITQRELNVHTHSFTNAIRSALRQDPDVVMVGEMRDLDTIAAAITLAETGHLVLSTLHTSDTVQTINRIIDVYPSYQQQQIRNQLAAMLKGVIAQVLIPRADADERVAVREIMIMNDGIRNCIAKGDISQIYSMIEIGVSEGMVSLDQMLEEYVRAGAISKENALAKASDFDSLNNRLKDVD